jgi:hypothetical protein
VNDKINWLKVGLVLVQGLANLIIWARERELIDQGAQEALANALRKQAEDLDKAREADRLVDAARDAGRLRELGDNWTRD